MTLFDEIAGTASKSFLDPVRATREEVIRHLERLCTVRRGSLLMAPDYGIGDVTFLYQTFPGGLDTWRKELEETLARYEPRLHNARVVPLVGKELDLNVRVEIQASLVVGDRVIPTRFEAIIDPQRHVRVQ
ncbi:MAG: type VI secretion system baseplate subunit TssE [Polyangiaceae bacterium]|nr:type VI secretion system baseplate subunit TssE [Polyangiaceae bacterium]